MNCILDGKNINTREELHVLLKLELNLPEWYGNNMDALHDCLTSISKPVHLTFLNYQDFQERLSGYAGIFVRVLADSAAENSNFSFSLYGGGETDDEI